METLKTDILIVGSGPAGSTAAKYAAEKGVKVTFIERRKEVGVPVRCGEFLPCIDEIKSMFPKAENLEETFILPSEQKVRETEAIRLVDPKGRITDLPFIGFTIDRDRYDQYQADQAVKAEPVEPAALAAEVLSASIATIQSHLLLHLHILLLAMPVKVVTVVSAVKAALAVKVAMDTTTA